MSSSPSATTLLVSIRRIRRLGLSRREQLTSTIRPRRTESWRNQPCSIENISLSLLRASNSLYWERQPLSAASISLSLLRASVSLYWEHQPLSMESTIAPSIIIKTDANMENVINDIVVLGKTLWKGCVQSPGKAYTYPLLSPICVQHASL
jgi:hypothetical protein